MTNKLTLTNGKINGATMSTSSFDCPKINENFEEALKKLSRGESLACISSNVLSSKCGEIKSCEHVPTMCCYYPNSGELPLFYLATRDFLRLVVAWSFPDASVEHSTEIKSPIEKSIIEKSIIEKSIIEKSIIEHVHDYNGNWFTTRDCGDCGNAARCRFQYCQVCENWICSWCVNKQLLKNKITLPKQVEFDSKEKIEQLSLRVDSLETLVKSLIALKMPRSRKTRVAICVDCNEYCNREGDIECQDCHKHGHCYNCQRKYDNHFSTPICNHCYKTFK
jgi:hypothetical protein